jgi:hypothetical protein
MEETPIMKNRTKFVVYACMALMLLAAAPLAAWEPPVHIAGQPDFLFMRPSIKFGPSGRAYVVYEARDQKTGRNDIFLRSYNGTSISAVTNVTEGNPYARSPYYPDIAVTKNEELHVVWVEYQRGAQAVAQYVKYRFFNGKTWGPIEDLATIALSDWCEDLRVAADSDNNMFAVIWNATKGRCSYISKYFGKKATVGFPVEGRSKHADIACDDNYIHIVWQHLLPIDYGIMYQRRPNVEGTSWEKAVNMNAYYTQRPRLDLDNNGNPHVAFWEDRGNDRRLWYRAWNGNLTSRDKTVMISTDEYVSYHFLDFSIKNNSMFATWQAGNYFTGFSGIVRYARKRSGANTWEPQADMPDTPSPVLVASDQTWDGSIAGVVYADGNVAITLHVSDKLVTNNLPQAVIAVDKEEVFWGESVNFNGSGSSDSDGSIVKYEWRVIQDKANFEGATASYKFDVSYGSVRVRLTVTDDKNGIGTADKIINVKALYTAPATWSWQKISTLLYNREGNVVKWTANAKNEAAGYNIVNYRIFRKETGGAFLQIGEVTADRSTFADVTAGSGIPYVYAVAAVDDQGRQSPYDNF